MTTWVREVFLGAVAALFPFVPCAAQVAPAQAAAVAKAAARFQPDVKWRPESVITGDFSCRGRVESAIIGTNASKIVVSIFTNGLERKPEDIEYYAVAFTASSLSLKTESMDFDVKELADQLGYDLQGMTRSKSCKGINLGDGLVDSAHIYWNRVSREFDVWRL